MKSNWFINIATVCICIDGDEYADDDVDDEDDGDIE
jgi:hypothetical protein